MPGKIPLPAAARRGNVPSIPRRSGRPAGGPGQKPSGGNTPVPPSYQVRGPAVSTTKRPVHQGNRGRKALTIPKSNASDQRFKP